MGLYGTTEVYICHQFVWIIKDIHEQPKINYVVRIYLNFIIKTTSAPLSR